MSIIRSRRLFWILLEEPWASSHVISCSHPAAGRSEGTGLATHGTGNDLVLCPSGLTRDRQWTGPWKHSSASAVKFSGGPALVSWHFLGWTGSTHTLSRQDYCLWYCVTIFSHVQTFLSCIFFPAEGCLSRWKCPHPQSSSRPNDMKSMTLTQFTQMSSTKKLWVD